MASIIQKANDKAIKDALDLLVSGKMFNFSELTSEENRDLTEIVKNHIPPETRSALSSTNRIIIQEGAPDGAPPNAVAYVTSEDLDDEQPGNHTFHIIASRLCSRYENNLLLKTICATLNTLVIAPHEIGHIDDVALSNYKQGKGDASEIYLPEHSAEGAEPPDAVIDLVAEEVHSFLEKVSESKAPSENDQGSDSVPENIEDLLKESSLIAEKSKNSFDKLKNIFITKWL